MDIAEKEDLALQIFRHLSELLDREDFEGARRLAYEGIEFCKQEPYFKLGVAAFYNEIGWSFERRGRSQQAHDSFIKAETECPREKSLYSNICINLARRFFFMYNKPRDGKIYFDRIDGEKLLESGDINGYLQFLQLRAELLSLEGNLPEAFKIIFREVIPLANERLRNKDPRSHELKMTLTEAYNLAAQHSYTLSRSEDPRLVDDARRLLAEAEKHAQQSPSGLAEVYLLQALFDISSSKNQAKDRLDKILSMPPGLVNRTTFASATILMAKYYSMSGDDTHAEEFLKKGLDLCDQIISSMSILDLRAGSSNYENFNTALGDICSLLISQGRNVEAIGYVEVGKAREMFNNDVSRSQTQCKKREESIGIINSLHKEIRKLEKELESESNATRKPDKLKGLYAHLMECFDKRRQIEDEIWKACPDPGVTLPKNPTETFNRFVDVSRRFIKDGL